MSRSASSSTSSLIISENSKVKLSDFDLTWQESLKSAWKKLKAQVTLLLPINPLDKHMLTENRTKTLRK
ncbi:hypothetical protein K469DRAFT_702344 [Zopfia rhizophila CBS 207.26]|uniref:Uncharacterized protein n=1 Tax=Zopfia rhizophila CBS 207.26 TaxID=1314779 RepID=A0A6A6D766_9PEZI|nr:hypothetical protein K469DRAFT_702344 [Zopfia rhizophila CBS 207.26]